MALSTTASRVQYLGDGSTTVFTITFEFFANTDLKVYSTVIATGVSTLLALTTDYTVTGAGVGTGGTLTMNSAPANTVRITIARVVNLIQASVYNEDADFPVKVVEGDFDYSMMTLQQQADLLSRSFQIPITDPTGTIINIPNSVERANKVLSFDGAGNVSATIDGGYYRGNWVTATVYFFRDLFSDPLTGNLYFTQIIHTSTNIAADVVSGYIVKILDTVSITGPAGAAGSPGSSFAGITTGSSNAYAATFVGYTYTDGAAITIVPNFTNDPIGGVGSNPAVTLNINSLGAKNIYGRGGIPLQEGSALVNGVPITLRYYNSKFYIEPISSSPKLFMHTSHGQVGNPLSIDGINRVIFGTSLYISWNNYTAFDGTIFTAPRDGIYQVSGNINMSATSTIVAPYAILGTGNFGNVTAPTYLQTLINNSSGNPGFISFSQCYNLVSGDTIAVALKNITAGTFVAPQNSPLFLYFSLYQITEL